MKYIDSDAVARILTDPQYPYVPKIERAVLDIPAANVAPVIHGKWKPHKTMTGKNWWECSVCGFVSEHKVNHNYCPNCGAKMDGEESDGKELMKQAADAIEDLEFACNRYEKDYKALCKYLPKWIPMTERAPELNAPCLVYNKSQPMMVGWRVDDKRFRIPGSRFPDHPTHWMPLHEPPKEES